MGVNQLNGVEIEALNETCALLEKKPELGKSQFRLHNTWQSGGHNRATIGTFFAGGQEQSHSTPFVFDEDEPPALLGGDQGANPVEYLLTALSGCMTTSIIYHATANGVTVDSLESDFCGDLDLRGFLDISDDVPKGYQKIDVTFTIKTNGTEEQIRKYLTFSPVYAMLSRAVPINVTVVKH